MNYLKKGRGGVICVLHSDFVSGQESHAASRNRKLRKAVWTAEGKEAVSLFDPSQEPGLPCVLWGKLYRRSLFYKDEIQQTLNQYKKKLPHNFFEDIFIFPRLLSAADRVTVINRTEYYHRINESGLSHAKAVSAYHYEQIDAMAYNNEYFMKKCMDDYLKKQLQPQFLLCLRTWYMAHNFEKRRIQEKQFTKKLKQFYRDYYGIYKNSSRISKERIVIGLWNRFPNFWNWLLGRLYFHSHGL